jgi:transcription-repair coupling factor (superfamily II helicase)
MLTGGGAAPTVEELDLLRQEMIDRFGQYPEPVENLFRYARLRQETLALQIQSVEKIRIKYSSVLQIIRKSMRKNF